MSFITRFAPSPTGPLHLGHAYSALRAHDSARAENGRFLLRIEDTDQARCRPEWETQIFADLVWLGLSWETPVMRQSARGAAYDAALARLAAQGLLYPCSCKRSDIRAAASAPQEGVRDGVDGVVYPGTCRGRDMSTRAPGDALRLDIGRACTALDQKLSFEDYGERHSGSHIINATELIDTAGDIVLSRRDGAVAYHLAVCVDDAEQAITDVIRGEDLFVATPVHILLQALLGYRHPRYCHHPLIRDETGKRLAKRDDARAIALFRQDGKTPDDLRRMVGL